MSSSPHLSQNTLNCYSQQLQPLHQSTSLTASKAASLDSVDAATSLSSCLQFTLCLLSMAQTILDSVPSQLDTMVAVKILLCS